MRTLRLAGLFVLCAFAAVPAAARSRSDVDPSVLPAIDAARARTPHSPSRALAAAPGEILVALPRGESFAVDARGGARVPGVSRAAMLANRGLEPARVLGRSGAAMARRARSAGAGPALGGRFAVLRSHDPNFDAAAVAAELRASGQFAAACPNVAIELLETLPNDSRLAEQWWVKDDTNADVQLPEAWDVTHGSSSIVIAILDTGVDTGHPDLASRIWFNSGEIAGNSIDDDGNGYVDDLQGWDFGDGDADANPGPLINEEIGLDEGFHGTFCAGLASAATNNAEGIAGAGWNSRIMPLKIFDSNFGSTAAMLTDAIGYAIDNGASVISMSIGALGEPGIPEFFQALIDEANDAGVICVAAAGNSGVDVPVQYPAACDHVISVAATDDANNRAEFSNWGPTVDVAAPGAFVLSTLCRNYEIDELNQIFYLYFFYWDGETPYMYGDGTSFACPIVAGVCALVLDQKPLLTPDQMEAHLIATGDGVNYDQAIGPRVNAFAAVTTGATAVEPARVASRLALSAPVPNPSAGLSRLAFSLPGDGPAELAVFDAGGRRVRTLASGFLPAGTREVRWDGRDENGAPAPAGLYFGRLTAGGEQQVVRLARLPR